MIHDQQAQKSIRPFRLLWELSSGFRWPYSGAILALLAGTLLNFLIPLIASATIDLALSSGAESSLPARWALSLLGGAEMVEGRLWWPALWMVLLTALSGCSMYVKGRGTALASEGIARRLKERLFAHLQRLPVRYHDRAESGDVIQRCTSDVETLRMALSTQVVEVSNATLLMLTSIPLMILLDPRMTLASVILLGPIIVFGYIYFGRVRMVFREVDEAEGAVTGVIQENLNGLRVVRAFARQSHEIEKFAGPNAHYRDRGLHLIRLMANYWSISDLVVLSQNGITLLVGIFLIREGSLTVGTLFAFLMFLNLMLWPVRMMGRILTELGKTQVALSRVGEILAEPEEADAPGARTPLDSARGGLEVRGLSFAHQSGVAALSNLSFRIEPGQTLAILGPSGSGKSTLMHLLLRLYDYSEGSILIDGMELRELTRSWVRAQFSVVLQEPFLYSKTIGENILLGSSDAPPRRMTEAARLAHIHDTIEHFPSGYRTLLGERGVTLSGGQRQRVALARAFLRETPFLLLDDALSAVDAETEAGILDALRSRRGKRTTIVIAHRLSTLAHADQIIVLDHGRIVQRGNHESLVSEDGLYRRLWEIQNLSEAGGAA